jgi:hypothetical protein
MKWRERERESVRESRGKSLFYDLFAQAEIEPFSKTANVFRGKKRENCFKNFLT